MFRAERSSFEAKSAICPDASYARRPVSASNTTIANE